MGLGKTLQATAILAASHVEHTAAGTQRPSLVVCPTTLVSHWAHEINKFLPRDMLHVLEYHGASKVGDDVEKKGECGRGCAAGRMCGA